MARNWAFLLLIGLIWGSSFILMKKGLTVFTNGQVAALRIGLAWLVTMPFLLPAMRSITGRQWLILLSVGLFGNGIPAFLFTAAQVHLDSSVVGMLNSMVPVLTVAIGVLAFGLQVNRHQWLGIATGLAGAAMLILPSGISGFQWQALLVVAASSCYALNLNVVKTRLQQMPTTIITAGAFLWVGPACVAYLLCTDLMDRMQLPGATMALGAVSLLAVVGTAVAVQLFNRLIQTAGTVFASTVTYIVPVFAVMWGMLDGERPAATRILGVVTVLVGVHLINKSQKADI